MLSQESYISIYSHFNTVSHFLLTNDDTPIRPAQIIITPFPCWRLKRCWRYRLFMTQHLLQQPSMLARDSGSSMVHSRFIRDENLRKVDLHVMFYAFQIICMYLFVNGGVVPVLCHFLSFFRRRHWVVPDRVFFSNTPENFSANQAWSLYGFKCNSR